MSLQVGVEDQPIFSRTYRSGGRVIMLEYSSEQLTAARAVALMSNVAGRVEQ